jgi:hypothetical protein
MWWKKKSKKLLFNLLLLLWGDVSFGAPCCGSGFTIPSIITSDDKAQLSLNYTYSLIHSDVLTNGDWRLREEKDLTEIYKIEGAHIFKDRYQWGISAPFQKRTREGAQSGTSEGLGDISLQLGFEYLPDWDYHPLRPKGIGYLSVILPTGRSIYESSDGSGLDARGRGFWGLGAGTIFTKSFGPWDGNLNLEAHYSFPKKVSNKTTKGTVIPGPGGSSSLGGGYNWKSVRLGGLLQAFYESPTDVQGSTSSQGTERHFVSSSLLLSYLFKSNETLVMSYNDQTLFGSPLNTSLSKSVTLFYQKRWQR